jgi:hypothetical protein
MISLVIIGGVVDDSASHDPLNLAALCWSLSRTNVALIRGGMHASQIVANVDGHIELW